MKIKNKNIIESGAFSMVGLLGLKHKIEIFILRWEYFSEGIEKKKRENEAMLTIKAYITKSLMLRK